MELKPVVDYAQLATHGRLVCVLRNRLHRQLAACTGALNRGQMFLRHAEADPDRVHSVDHHQIGAVGANDVAFMHNATGCTVRLLSRKMGLDKISI